MPYLPDSLRFGAPETMRTWIVVFKPHTSIEEISAYVHEVERAGGRVLHTYYHNFKGFSATMSDNFVKALQSARSDIIDYIEQDQEIHIMS
ncbi:hypothetical protein FRC01_014593 [Tulasnella sp. 417]|nr:hypothetical protein FRC01_014593 [Tulasnella sp. 417]